MRRRHLLPLLVGGMLTASCWKWSGTTEFIGKLRCGMSEENIRAVASSFRGLEVGISNDRGFGDLVAFKSGTKIWMGLDQNRRLRAIIYTWDDGVMSAAYSLKEDICARSRSVVVRVGGMPQLGGALLYIDGRHVGKLSPRLAVADIDVPLGRHELRVEKCGFRPWMTQVRFSSDSNGYFSINVPPLPKDPSSPCDDSATRSH